MRNSVYSFPLILIFFIWVLDLVFVLIAKGFYFSEKSKANDPLIYSITNSKDDIIVFGSSRAKHHYNTKMITDSLGISSYNFGNGGQNIYYHEILLRNLLESHTPKVVILELMTIDFQNTPPQWEKDKLNVLLPFSEYSMIIDKELKKLDKYHKIKSIINSYKFNSQVYKIIRNNFLPYNNHLNGYIPIVGNSWSKQIQIDNSKIDSLNYDDQKIQKIYSFIETCFERNITIYLCVSPVFLDYENNSPYANFIKDLEVKYGLKTFQFLNHPEFNSKPEYFKDPLHLNSSGAKKFTEVLLDSLKANNPKLDPNG